MSYEIIHRLLDTCLDADLPLLIEGPHGAGKSEIVRDCAEKRNIGFVALDLSAAEPVDLLGLPSISSGVTEYLIPACLPRGGSGILFFDELNRALRQVRAVLLNLITMRHVPLSNYRLPEGWRIVAACNPANGSYQVDELDEALVSRFVRVKLEPEVSAWLEWAVGEGVHPEVIAFVRAQSRFSRTGNPRAWHMLSRWMTSNSAWKEDPETLSACAEGLVGPAEGRAFAAYLFSNLRPLRFEQILAGESAYQASIHQWVRAKRVDLFHAAAEAIRIGLTDFVKSPSDRATPEAMAKEIEKFARLCPADIRKQIVELVVRFRHEIRVGRA